MHAPIYIRSMHACSYIYKEHACMHAPILGLLSYIGLAFVYAFDCIYNNNLCFMLQRISSTHQPAPVCGSSGGETMASVTRILVLFISMQVVTCMQRSTKIFINLLQNIYLF